MIISLFYIVLALLGLSFLIFIHELGHYWMARRVGMRVETFAIGFGHPIYSWTTHDGVKWQIGWLLFGGYVKIAGQDIDSAEDPYSIKDGFFGKSPLDRIKVALMGPVMNIIMAIILFTILWLAGGREKNFTDFTHKIGWVDTESELYANGVRPGDELESYDGHPFRGAKDHLYAPMTGGHELNIKGYKVNYTNGDKTPFDHTVPLYQHPFSLEKGIRTTGITNSAGYVTYNKLGGQDNPLPEGSPLQDSGIQYGDRILWVDGELIFSIQQLNHILNDGRVLLTIKRGDEEFFARVPRVYVQELWLDSNIREELIDWQFEAGLNSVKFQKLYTIPYNLTNEGVVQNRVRFIDKDNEKQAFPDQTASSSEQPLQPGDKIVAVDGVAVNHSYEILKQVQEHKVYVIVDREPAEKPISWTLADQSFDKEIKWNDIQAIVNSIGSKQPVEYVGTLRLLKPVFPKTQYEFILTPEKQAQVATDIQEKRKEIESIEDPEARAHAYSILDKREKQLLLGLPGVQDHKVNYNPMPLQAFSSVFEEIWGTLVALFSGNLNPKWISGPIGIVQVVQENWKVGIKEAIFWLGAISLNLGILNLLPIPVLDGGTILITLFEMVTGRRMKPKTMEKLIIPFAVLLITFFIYLTYNDLSRIWSNLFH